MPTLLEKIDQLNDQQALSIVDSLAGEFATEETPETKTDQAQALQSLMVREGYDIDLISTKADLDLTRAAKIARQLLALMAQVPEVRPSLEEWLDNPPRQEAAAIPLILAAPVVFTGCIALLNVVGHVHYVRHRDGTWEIKYDPSTKTPLDKTMKDTIKTLASLMSLLSPK